MKQFYTYLWLREDGTPYYVGKGLLTRAYLRRTGHVPPTDPANVITQEWDTEEEALSAEVFLIAYYGRKDSGNGILTNLTDGGDGFTGARHSESTRLGMRRRMLGNRFALGNVLSADVRRRMGDSRRGKKRPPEVTEKTRLANLGSKRSDETRRRISEAGRGRKVTDATRAKMSAVRKGRPLSEAHKAALRNKVFSIEHREALRAAALRRYATTNL